MNVVTLAYLGSHFLSLLGNGIAAVALPLIVLQITGSPLSMGAISAATAIPAVAIGLVAGFVLDRWNRRDASIIADVVSSASIAALPVVDAIFGLELWWFIVLGIIGAMGDVPGSTAREVLVAAVAQRTGASLERLVGLRQTLTSAALVIGPAMAGSLVALLGGTAVLYVTAATSAAAALLTLFVPRATGRVDRDTAPQETPWQQVTGGFSVLRRSRFLVATVVLMMGLATVLAGLQGLVLPLYFTEISQPAMLGLVLTVLAVGMLVGAVIFSIFGPRLRRRTVLTIGFVALTVGFLGLSSVVSVAVVFASAFVVGVSNAMMGGVLGVLQVERTPDHARGRVLALQGTALQLAAPAGIGVASIVAEVGSLQWAGFAVCALWLIAVVVILASRSLINVERDGSPDDAQ